MNVYMSTQYLRTTPIGFASLI